MLPNHPEVAQRKQRLQSRSVLGQATVSSLREAELTRDDLKRMLNLRLIPALTLSAALRSFPEAVPRFNTRRLPGIIAMCQFT